MPFTFKLSKRLALLKGSLAASAILTLACTSDLTDPQAHRNTLSPVAISSDLTPLALTTVVASGYQDPNVPQNTLDNNLATRWSAYGDGQWIRYDLGMTMAIGSVAMAWHQGTSWASVFEIQVSLDDTTWTPAFSGRSSGQTLQPERYDFPTVTGRYVRIVGHGQWSGTTQLSQWNSITEVAIYGTAAVVDPVPVAVTASGYQDPNVPQNTLDNNLATRWSANGDGQWIQYDLGTTMAVSTVTIAWYQGTSWASPFEIEVSLDGTTRTPVFTGRSSGQTLQPERYDFPTVTGRYVRIVGHGQWSGTTQLSLWNSISEVAIYAGTTVTVHPVPVASVAVSPASPSIAVGQTVQLAAVTKDAAGNVLTGRTVTWSSSNTSVATVSGTGLVTGLTAGTATITATSEGVASTAATTVTAPTNPGTVTDLAVVGVADTGVTLAFTEVTDGTGLPASYDVRYQVGTITWGSTAPSATRGTCTTPVAGTAIGAKRTCTVLGLTPATAYQFQLTEFRGTLNLNAIFGGLSNIAGATTAPSSTGTGGGPQPGPTAIIIIQDGFESGDLSQWGFQSDAGSGRYSITTDPTRVKSGTHSLQALYTTTNAYGMITRWFMPGYDEVYVKFNVLFEEGFQNLRPDGAGMHFFVLAGNRIDDSHSSWGKPAIVPNGTDYFYAGLDPEERSLPTLQPFSYYTYWPDMSCCYGTMLFQPSPKTALVPGQWQEVVFHLKLNTIGQADGLQEVWINGVKKLGQQNMRWRTTTDLRINEIRFDNYMRTAPQTEHVWVDDVTVWRP